MNKALVELSLILVFKFFKIIVFGDFLKEEILESW